MKKDVLFLTGVVLKSDATDTPTVLEFKKGSRDPLGRIGSELCNRANHKTAVYITLHKRSVYKSIWHWYRLWRQGLCG